MERDLLENILNVSRRMAETRDLMPLLNYVVDEGIKLVGAERGYVVLTQPDGVLDFRVQRDRDGQELEESQDQISRSILHQIIETGQPLVLRDATQDPNFREAESVVILGLRSIMCVPLISQGDTIGAIYVENRSIRGRFSQDDAIPLVLFANQAAVAITNAHLFQTLEEARDELEVRVEERTQELSEANALLKQEVAERVHVEKALKRSEATLKSILRAAPTGIGLATNRVLGWTNDTLQGMVGRSGDELAGKSARILYESDEEFERVGRKAYPEIAERGETIAETRFKHKDGNVIDVLLGSSLIDSTDPSAGIVFTVMDITERKRVTAEVREMARFPDENPNPVLRVAKDGTILYANKGSIPLLDTWGCRVGERLPDDGQQIVRDVLISGLSRVVEVAHKDGVLSLTFAPVADADCINVYGLDITERKQAEEELRNEKEFTETALNSQQDTFFLFEPATGRAIRWNRVFNDITGYTDEEIARMPAPNSYYSPEDLKRASIFTEEVLKTGSGTIELELICKDGRKVATEYRVSAISDEEGKPKYIISIGRDITERKRAETAVRESEERLSSFMDSASDSFYLLDSELNFVEINKKGLEIVGKSKEEVIGRHITDIVPDVKESGRYEKHLEVIRTGQPFVVENYVPHPVFGDLLFVLKSFKVGDGLGVIASDITERKRAEDELRRAKDSAEEARRVAERARAEAEAANRAKSVFLANMSHELRTPLNAILGFSELMARDPNLTHEQQEKLATIGRSGEHLLALINDVLQLSKIEAGRAELQPDNFDLHQMLLGLGEMFGLRTKAKGLTLVFDLASAVPQYVRADQGKLRQVLINLLGNAVKFTHEGGITLRVKAKPDAKATERGSTLHFEVADTGVGIALDELDQVFDIFVQTSSGQQSTTGTGLGMPISREFVRMMGGDLTVSSEVGVGTVFQFDVPVEIADAAEVKSAQPPRRVVGLEPGQRATDGGPYRLLVVEDVDANRKLLVEILRSRADPTGDQDFEVQEAVNGQEAIEMWEKWKPHLIWMDIRMPVMDGLEATRRIKAHAGDRPVPIIVALTASPFEEEREGILSVGCDDFIRKPIHEADIFDTLTKHLGVRFVYEEIDEEIELEKLEIATLKPQISDLPPALLTDLEHATVVGDMTQILDLIDQIHPHDAIVADTLKRLASDFEFAQILTLIRDADGQE